MSKKIEGFLKKVAKERQLELNKLQAEYQEIIRSLKDRKIAGDLSVIARNIILGRHRQLKPYKRARKYQIASFVGFKIGDLGIKDDAQRMREWARFIIDRDGVEEAKRLGLVAEQDDKIVVLDTREKVFGRPNKNYRQPLDPKLKLRRRTLIMLAKEGNGELEYTRLQTNNNKLALAWSQLPFYRPVAFPAAVQNHDNSGYLLSSSSAEATKTIFREVKEDWDVYSLYEAWAKENLTPFEDVIRYHDATKDAWDRWILLRGIVASINLESQSFRGTPCMLIDPERGYDSSMAFLFYIPEHLKITFGVYSEIYLLGKTRGIETVDEETGQEYTSDVAIDAWGFMPIKGRSTKPEESLLEEEAEEEVQGFIPAE